MIRLEPLGPEHAAQILAGQDQALADDIIGRPWDAHALGEFLQRAARWRADGPIREYAACDGRAPAALVGGGGLNRLAPTLERREAALTYWVLREHRGRGYGGVIAGQLLEIARSDSRIDRLILQITPENRASREVARSIGARPTGRTEPHPADAGRSVQRWTLDL